MENTFAENLKALGNAEKIKSIGQIRLYSGDEQVGFIPLMKGKMGSLQVYEVILRGEDGEVTKDMAERGLELFAENVSDEVFHLGKPPHIDHLLEVGYFDGKLRAEFDYV